MGVEASLGVLRVLPSMKVPPKRKGNIVTRYQETRYPSLNESPSEKEGKSRIQMYREQGIAIPQ